MSLEAFFDVPAAPCHVKRARHFFQDAKVECSICGSDLTVTQNEIIRDPLVILLQSAGSQGESKKGDVIKSLPEYKFQCAACGIWQGYPAAKIPENARRFIDARPIKAPWEQQQQRKDDQLEVLQEISESLHAIARAVKRRRVIKDEAAEVAQPLAELSVNEEDGGDEGDEGEEFANTQSEDGDDIKQTQE